MINFTMSECLSTKSMGIAGVQYNIGLAIKTLSFGILLNVQLQITIFLYKVYSSHDRFRPPLIAIFQYIVAFIVQIVDIQILIICTRLLLSKNTTIITTIVSSLFLTRTTTNMSNCSQMLVKNRKPVMISDNNHSIE